MTTSSIPLPARVDQITPAWLSQALASRFPGVEVEAMEITNFIDGTAQKVRFEITYAGDVDAPRSLWVKGGFDPKGAQQGEAFANEVRFFIDLAPLLNGVNIPFCYHGAIDSSSNNGVVVLEDLIARGATFGRATEPLGPDEAAAVLSLQARYHARFWNNREVDRFDWLKPGGAIAAAGVVDQYFGMWDAAAPLPRFTYLTAEQRERSRVQKALNNLMLDLREKPICLLHGDSQGGNLFFEADRTPGYLDWQHTMLGCWAFDVSGFLVTSVTVEDRRAHERDLLAHYLQELSRNGVTAPDFEQAWDEYARYAMWPFMWVMCPVEAHPEEVCSLNSERACAAIADLGTLAKLGV